MKLFISIIAVLILTASLAAAGTVPTEQGDKAMVFSFHGFDHLGLGTYPGADLGMFVNLLPEDDYYEEYRDDDDEEMLDMLAGFTGGLGMRYYIADNTAIRGGLLLSMASATVENDAKGWTDNEMSLSSYGVELVYERHIDVPYEPISPYLGIAGNFSMTTVTLEPSHMEDMPDDCYYYDWCQMLKSETSISTFGIAGVLGFEWAFVDGMTLGGEYRLGFTSMSGEMTDDYECCEGEYEDLREITTESCTDKFSASVMGFSTTALMLSVYW